MLAQIVKGTGCSGTWLLTGEGEMFGSETTRHMENGISPMSIHSFLGFIEEVQKDPQALKNVTLPDDIDTSLAKLLVKILEWR